MLLDITILSFPCSGPKLSLDLETGDQVTVESLLDETYQKASAFRLWPLLRHTAGLLHKNVEDLAQVSLRGLCCVFVCMSVCVYICVHVCTYVNTYVCVCVYTVHIIMYVCMYVCMYV